MKSLTVLLFALFTLGFVSCSDDHAEIEELYIDSPDGEDDEVEETREDK